MKEINKTFYVSNDGIEFINQNDCVLYEIEKSKRDDVINAFSKMEKYEMKSWEIGLDENEDTYTCMVVPKSIEDIQVICAIRQQYGYELDVDFEFLKERIFEPILLFFSWCCGYDCDKQNPFSWGSVIIFDAVKEFLSIERAYEEAFTFFGRGRLINEV